MDKLVRAKQARLYELRGKSVSYGEAYSEVVADSMEAMLADGNVLEKLADPVAIIHDKRIGKASASESNVDVIVEMTVASGKTVLAAIQISGNGRINGIRIDTNKVSTVHGNTDSIARLVDAINEHQNGNVAVFYINNDKTTKVIQRTGNPIPSDLSNLDGFINSISDPKSPVKRRFGSVVETQQFKRWFLPA